jgi:hypothetical protein
MSIPEALLSRAPWRKSSRSGGGNATCVEAVALDIGEIDGE